MAKLVYSMLESLDGYVADASGKFDWAEPDESVHEFLRELEIPIGTYLYGRRMYEVMEVWETLDQLDDAPPFIRDYAEMWRSADKIVYSATLDRVRTPRTTIERVFDPEVVRRLKAESTRDISIGGPTLAAHAISAGLVDEYQMIVVPVIVGGGTRSFPEGVRLGLELVDHRRFDNGMVYLHYRPIA